MVRCFAAFLDFCYLARRSAHDTSTLNAMDNALQRFHHYRTIFEEVGVRTDGFSLPRQHALVHYVKAIKFFGSPNGVCSSITESKHIRAVKRPWRRSSKYNPLGQILRTNTRLSKLEAASVDFKTSGMLSGDVLDNARRAIGISVEDDILVDWLEEEDVMDAEGDHVESVVRLPNKHGMFFTVYSLHSASLRLTAYSRFPDELANEINQPSLPELIQRFLWDQEHPDIPAEELPLDDCPKFDGRISVYRSATATFYAPSELAGPGGMHSEIIRCAPGWRNEYDRFDTVLIQNEDNTSGMRSMVVGRVICLLAFVHEGVRYPCALVRWLVLQAENPDPSTGMWIVEPLEQNGQQEVGLVHLNCIFRACHLIPRFGSINIPFDFHFSYSLDVFKSFYVNSFVDYHAHECI